MNRYKISQLAEQDLEDIWVYLAQNNQVAADKQITKSRKHCNISCTFK
jgi:toxin ParE1/3/4